jgi:glucosamine-6-phosphate deaminase
LNRFESLGESGTNNSMNIHLHPTPALADEAAANLLSGWLTSPGVRNLMLASGNTPIGLYERIAGRKLPLKHLTVFALDEYVGVPLDEPRNTANLLRRAAVEPWGIPPTQFFSVSSLEAEALASIQRHERRIEEAGGLDVIVLGLGQNGHLAFNEPGSAPESVGRVLDLETISIEANRKWFGGKYAPAKGATVGLKTILAARRVLIQAYGAHKTTAVKAMVEGKIGPHCPASFLQQHPNVDVFLDDAAAAGLKPK